MDVDGGAVNDRRGLMLLLLLLLLLIDLVKLLHSSSFDSRLFRRRRQYRDDAMNADADETVIFEALFSSMCVL